MQGDEMKTRPWTNTADDDGRMAKQISAGSNRVSQGGEQDFTSG